MGWKKLLNKYGVKECTCQDKDQKGNNINRTKLNVLLTNIYSTLKVPIIYLHTLEYLRTGGFFLSLFRSLIKT